MNSSPQCPQNHIDVGYLLRIPSSLDEDQEKFEEDEFHCLNINVSLPAEFNPTNGLLPVLIWIHGTLSVLQHEVFLSCSRWFTSRQLSTSSAQSFQHDTSHVSFY